MSIANDKPGSDAATTPPQISTPDDSAPAWVEAVIEIPRGSRNKYEYDHERDIMRLDRVLYSSMHYPTDYGFIVDTLAGDGDPLDILVIVEEPTFPGCHLRARPIGTLTMRDEMGMDEKILAVLVDDPRYVGIRDLDQLQPHWTREIAAFFRTYKELQGVEVEVKGWRDAAAAWQVIAAARARAAGHAPSTDQGS